MDSEPEAKLTSLIYQLISMDESTASTLDYVPVITQMMSLLDSMDLDSESELISLVKRIIYLVSSEPESGLKPLVTQMISIINSIDSDHELMLLITQIIYYPLSLEHGSELRSCIERLFSVVRVTTDQLISTDLYFEPKLISLISDIDVDMEKFASRVNQVISFVVLVDLDLQPKPQSKLMSLVSQTLSLFNSMDLDSLPKPLSNLISLVSQKTWGWNIESNINKTMNLEPEPELVSLFHQIFSLAISMEPKWQGLICLSPQAETELKEEKNYLIGKVELSGDKKRGCLPIFWDKCGLSGENATHFRCRGCNGENHGGYEKAPVKVKHPLHPKHFLQLLLLSSSDRTRNCYCCGELLEEIFYWRSNCDFVMNVACVAKPPVLTIDYSKWHEHQLVHFPRPASLTCDLCALPDSSSPFFICPPCDFVVHQSCTSLPHVIKISRHPHRISFTPSFGQGNLSCGVCRREIDNNYGGYSCIKAGCTYAAFEMCYTEQCVGWYGA